MIMKYLHIESFIAKHCWRWLLLDGSYYSASIFYSLVSTPSITSSDLNQWKRPIASVFGSRMSILMIVMLLLIIGSILLTACSSKWFHNADRIIKCGKTISTCGNIALLMMCCCHVWSPLIAVLPSIAHSGFIEPHRAVIHIITISRRLFIQVETAAISFICAHLRIEFIVRHLFCLQSIAGFHLPRWCV